MIRPTIEIIFFALVLLKLFGGGYGIINGSPSKNGQFPYAIFVLAKDRVFTGSLVASDRVLTAAHCIYGLPRIPTRFFGGVCFAGEVALVKGDLSKSKSLQSRLIWQYAIHPNYKGHNAANDVAIITVRAPFNLNKYVATIKLAKKDLKKNDECISLGFGWQAWNNSPTVHTDLAWFKSQVFEIGCMKGKSICTRSNGKGTDYQDSGGPLIRKSNENIVYGVGSFLINRDNPLDGVAYASVAENWKFIDESMGIYQSINPHPRSIARGPRHILRYPCLLVSICIKISI